MYEWEKRLCKECDGEKGKFEVFGWEDCRSCAGLGWLRAEFLPEQLAIDKTAREARSKAMQAIFEVEREYKR